MPNITLSNFEQYHWTYHYVELLEEAATERLAKQATAGKTTLADRLLSELGDLLISSGARLKSRRVQKIGAFRQPVFQKRAVGDNFTI